MTRSPHRLATAVALTGLAFATLLSVAGVALLVAGGSPLAPHPQRPDVADGAANLLLLSYPAVGGLLASRLPRNPLGWLLLLSGVGTALEDFAGVYAHHAFEGELAPLPGAAYVALFGDSLWFPSLLLGIVLVLLLFPDGRPLSPRWRVVAWLTVAAAVASIPVTVLLPGPLYFLDSVANPLGWPAAGPVLQPLQAALGGVMVACMLAAVGSAVLRVRRSRGVERQQLKWFLAAVAVLPVVTGFAVLNEDNVVGSVSFELGLLALPIAIAIAVLRYRLYDIDRLIRRTVAYTVVTGLLVGTYAGVVVLLQQSLGPVLADSDLAVAGATLLAAALFRPLLVRIQAVVDRRFDRARVDAARTVATFGARLRDDLDLDSLSHELRTTAAGTVHPTQLGLWLRP